MSSDEAAVSSYKSEAMWGTMIQMAYAAGMIALIVNNRMNREESRTEASQQVEVKQMTPQQVAEFQAAMQRANAQVAQVEAREAAERRARMEMVVPPSDPMQRRNSAEIVEEVKRVVGGMFNDDPLALAAVVIFSVEILVRIAQFIVPLSPLTIYLLEFTYPLLSTIAALAAIALYRDRLSFAWRTLAGLVLFHIVRILVVTTRHLDALQALQ